MAGLPIARIWEIASFDPGIHTQVSLELLASWPVPSKYEGAVGYSFFYYASYGPPPAHIFKLWPPSWIVWIAGTDGSVRNLHRVEPLEMGLNAKRGEPFATHEWPKEWTYEVADQKRKDLLAAYDRVVPLWDAHRPLSPNETKILDDFRSRFLELTQPPLLPCYKALAGDFLLWLGI